MSRIYTSYYGNRHLPENVFRVQVSATRPRRYGVGAVLSSAIPDPDTIDGPWREGAFGEKTYTVLYTRDIRQKMDDILAELRTIERKAAGRPVVLLGYCGKDRFDSRRILAEQLRTETGEEIPEL